MYAEENATLRKQKMIVALIHTESVILRLIGHFSAAGSLFACSIFFFCYNSWCRHLLFVHDKKKRNFMKFFSFRVNSTLLLDRVQKRMPLLLWYFL